MELALTYRSILKVAFPIMLGSFIQFIVNFTDTAFVGQLGETALNAVGNAGLLYITLFVASQGFSTAIQIMVARRKSMKKPKQVGLIFDHAILFMALVSILLVAFILLFSEYGIQYVIRNQPIKEAMQGFLSYRSWGFLFSVIEMGILGYYMGIAKTKVLFYATAITAVLNVFLDYALIYGKFGFPEMGIQGAALASTLSEAISLVYVGVYVLRDKDTQFYGLFQFKRFIKKLLAKYLKLAYPLVAQRFLSLLAWTIFFFMIEKTSPHDLAVSQIIRSLYFLAFIPIMGYGSATSTFVSHYMGLKDFASVIKIMKKIGVISAITTFLFVHGYLFYPRVIIQLITPDEGLINDTIPILKLIITSMLLHSGVMVLFSAVSGVGDTKKSFWIEFSSIFIYLIYTFYVCIVNPQSLFVIWAAEFIYFGLLALFSLAYFKYGNWRNYAL